MSRKQQIVETVLDLVAQRGADAVSAQLIADAIGLTQPAVFRHFPTKEAIWTATIQWLHDQLANVWATARDDRQPPHPLEVLERMFLGHIDLIRRHPGLAKVVMSDHIRHEFPSLHGNFQILHRRYEHEISSLLETAAKRGDLPADTNITTAATLFFCMVQGLGFQFAIARYRRTGIRESAARVFALYLNGLRA